MIKLTLFQLLGKYVEEIISVIIIYKIQVIVILTALVIFAKVIQVVKRDLEKQKNNT
ncbi:MAG: hypothetical protein QG563_182 [Patescibacteria group bacterium]|jgi:hypothetical protein|nr:hypothetical protein [Patescibacteria group bacterium]